VPAQPGLMAPKRKAVTAEAPAVASKRTRGAAGGSAAAAKPPGPAKKEAKAGPAKKAKVKKVDPKAFAEVLLSICKVLMTVCESDEYEGSDGFSIVTVETFKEHGEALIQLLPEEARMPMMKCALIYREEIDEDPPIFVDEDDEPGSEESEDGEDGQDEDDGAGEDDDEDIMQPEHFYHFKRFFTEKEAADLVAGAEEDGAVAKAIEAALDSMANPEVELEEGDDDEDDDEDDEEGDEENDEDWTDINTPWKAD